jgi:hypothetical protein
LINFRLSQRIILWFSVTKPILVRLPLPVKRDTDNATGRGKQFRTTAIVKRCRDTVSPVKRRAIRIITVKRPTIFLKSTRGTFIVYVELGSWTSLPYCLATPTILFQEKKEKKEEEEKQIETLKKNIFKPSFLRFFGPSFSPPPSPH